jgi:hypothetical protein
MPRHAERGGARGGLNYYLKHARDNKACLYITRIPAQLDLFCKQKSICTTQQESPIEGDTDWERMMELKLVDSQSIRPFVHFVISFRINADMMNNSISLKYNILSKAITTRDLYKQPRSSPLHSSSPMTKYTINHFYSHPHRDTLTSVLARPIA